MSFFICCSRNACTEDYVLIYDGNSTSSRLIGRFCGRKVPDITASDRDIYIVFNSGPDTPPYGHNGFYGTAVGLTKGRTGCGINYMYGGL